MNSLKVLMVTSEFPPRIGGVATHVAELAATLRALGVTVEVLAPATPAPTRPEEGVIRYSPWFRGQPLADWLLARTLHALQRKRRYDLVHVHGLRPLQAARATGVPVIFTNHTSGFLKTVAAGGHRLARLGRRLGHCDYLLAPSEELVTAARHAGYAGPARYIPNGVDANRFSPGEASAERAAWQLPADAVAVVIARRLAPKNGVLDAARALAGTPANVYFIFAGDGSERPAMEQILALQGVAQRARFLGAVPNSNMVEIYRAADFCLLPSHMEATSIAGLEAMACGKALVGTRVGGIPALIAEGLNGLLVPPHAPDAIAAAVARLAEDDDAIRRMGLAARARVVADFAWPRIAGETLEVYRALIAEKAAAGASGN